MLNISEDKLTEFQKSPYRVVPEIRKRSSGKNLHPQLTIRVSEDLINRVRNKIQKDRETLKKAGIMLSYLKNFNTLTRYLFDRYLEGTYDYINELPKMMLPTDSPVLAIRQPEVVTTKLKEKMRTRRS